MSSTNASSSTSRCSSNGVTMAVMTDPMPGTDAIIPHVVEVEARDDVRVEVQDGPWPLDAVLRAGGAAHLAALRRRVPAHARRPGTGHDRGGRRRRARPAGGLLRHGGDRRRAGRRSRPARPGERAGGRRPAAPWRRTGGSDRAVGRGAGARRPRAARPSARGPAARSGAWHVVPSGMLEPEPDPIAAALVREAREELGVDVDPERGADARAGLGPRAAAPRGVRRARAGGGSGAGGGRRVRRRARRSRLPRLPPSSRRAPRAPCHSCPGRNVRGVGRD